MQKDDDFFACACPAALSPPTCFPGSPRWPKNTAGVRFVSQQGNGWRFPGSNDAKLIVGRNENEKKMLSMLVKDEDFLLAPASIIGPNAVGKGSFSQGLLHLACRIVTRYSDRENGQNADISCRRLPKSDEEMICE
jgi:hypothetical protein